RRGLLRVPGHRGRCSLDLLRLCRRVQQAAQPLGERRTLLALLLAVRVHRHLDALELGTQVLSLLRHRRLPQLGRVAVVGGHDPELHHRVPLLVQRLHLVQRRLQLLLAVVGVLLAEGGEDALPAEGRELEDCVLAEGPEFGLVATRNAQTGGGSSDDGGRRSALCRHPYSPHTQDVIERSTYYTLRHLHGKAITSPARPASYL